LHSLSLFSICMCTSLWQLLIQSPNLYNLFSMDEKSHSELPLYGGWTTHFASSSSSAHKVRSISDLFWPQLCPSSDLFNGCAHFACKKNLVLLMKLPITYSIFCGIVRLYTEHRVCYWHFTGYLRSKCMSSMSLLRISHWVRKFKWSGSTETVTEIEMVEVS